MLIPNTLFFFIRNERNVSRFPLINVYSVKSKRYWNNLTPEQRVEISKKCSIGTKRYFANRTPEQRVAYSAMRSRVQKETIKANPHLRKIRAKSFREVTQKYWDTVDEKKKTEHIKKMSAGMKNAWDSADENFGPKIPHERNRKIFLVKKIIKKDLPRINDYCGVLTSSQMAELNGTT